MLVVYIRKTLILNIDYPLSEKLELVNNALQNMYIVGDWAVYLPVSIKLSLPDLISMLDVDIAQRSHCHLESLGSLPRPTVGNPHTVCFMDWSRR